MIREILAKSGDTVLEWNGRLLASKFDPKAEARKWAENIDEVCSRSRTIFVLGAGSGPALELVLEMCPGSRVIVLSTQEEIVGFWRERTKALAGANRLHFLVVRVGDDLLKNELIREALQHSFFVLDHPSARIENPHFFQEAKALLVGRTGAGFSRQTQVVSFFSEFSKSLPKTIGAISIKTLADTTDRSEMQVLKELVK